jgi:hypothetical protein
MAPASLLELVPQLLLFPKLGAFIAEFGREESWVVRARIYYPFET